MLLEKRKTGKEALEEAVSYLKEAVEAKRCWSCGCFQNFLRTIDVNFPKKDRPEVLNELIDSGRKRLSEERYDCLGCELCYPPAILNVLELAGVIEVVDGGSCFSEKAEAREGWPPFAGAYHVLRYRAPVAICTLTNEKLALRLADEAGLPIAIIGTLQTENIGIERMIQNILSNPNIRFLILCGEDSRKAVGHLPGQSLVSLARSGIDEQAKIVGARGKRPALLNISREAVGHFRENVEVIDLIGESSSAAILQKARSLTAQNLGPSQPFSSEWIIQPLKGYLPKKMTLDPAGYFVIYVDEKRSLIIVEHYSNEGFLDVVIEGREAAELYVPAVEMGLLSRLDHACYLGRELARAEYALACGEPFTQDGAPERSPSRLAIAECDSACACNRS